MTSVKRNGIPRISSTIVLAGMFLIGVGLLLYPTVSDYWNSFHQSHAVMEYQEAVSHIDDHQFQTLWDEAEEYNRNLLEKPNRYVLSEEEDERYRSVLDINSTGIMSYIEIPALNVTLPIYHGTDDAVLQFAIGHIPGSSLPVGGESTHCVVSGHRGLPSARLFTNLDQLKEGDTFRIETLGQTLSYEVDQIRIVLPNELEDLAIESGKDYCTLVTCTPYGVNSHRLLVRGRRIENRETHVRVIDEAVQIDERLTALGIGLGLLILIGLTVMIRSFVRRLI